MENQNISKIQVRPLQIEDYQQLAQSFRRVYADGSDVFWTHEQIETLLRIFPEGQVVTVADDKIVGCALSIIVDYDLVKGDHTYAKVTGHETFSTHNPNGNILYGIEVFIHPDYRGLRLARRMYEYRKELCEKLNLKAIMFGGRIPNYHKYADRMRPKETLYSLSREFGIKLKRILRDNPEYTESSIVPEGAVVRLSLRQIDERALKMALEWEEQMERGEGGRKDQPVEIPPARLDSVRLDTVRPVATEEETEPRRVKVAVLLPLNVESNKLPSMGIFEQDTAEVRASDERWRLDTKSDIFVQFYQGVLMAADSLKRDGYTLDLHVFDTRRDVAECGRLAGALNMLAPDLIVGPVFANEFRAVAEAIRAQL